MSLNKFGDLEADMGSASLGRFNLKLSEVKSVKLEFRGEEPGCADYCPQRGLIWFECVEQPCT